MSSAEPVFIDQPFSRGDHEQEVRNKTASFSSPRDLFRPSNFISTSCCPITYTNRYSKDSKRTYSYANYLPRTRSVRPKNCDPFGKRYLLQLLDLDPKGSWLWGIMNL